jgi:hypothetical protein
MNVASSSRRTSALIPLLECDFGRSLEESRDDLQSIGYDTPALTVKPGSYTTLMDATARFLIE